jgi:hypothetical protein
MRDVLDHVLHRDQLVGLAHERVEARADFALTGVGDFVVMHFDDLAKLFEHLAHLAAQVLERVHRRHREIAALDAAAMAGVAAVERLVRRPRSFFRTDFIGDVAHVVAVTHRVEDEEFRLRAEERGVGDARRFQVRLGTLGDRTRIACVGLHRARLEHVALQDERLVRHERVDERRLRIGQQHHVRLVDALPAGDRRAVEHLAVFEQRLVDRARGIGDVMFLAEHVGKAQVDEFDGFVLDGLEDIGGSGHGGVR